MWQIVATNGTTTRKEQKMSNKLFWGLYATVFVVSSTAGYAVGIKHGREQLHFQEVECVDHPLNGSLVLCSRVRETVELEIEWN